MILWTMRISAFTRSVFIWFWYFSSGYILDSSATQRAERQKNVEGETEGERMKKIIKSSRFLLHCTHCNENWVRWCLIRIWIHWKKISEWTRKRVRDRALTEHIEYLKQQLYYDGVWNQKWRQKCCVLKIQMKRRVRESKKNIHSQHEIVYIFYTLTLSTLEIQNEFLCKYIKTNRA